MLREAVWQRTWEGGLQVHYSDDTLNVLLPPTLLDCLHVSKGSHDREFPNLLDEVKP